MATQVKRTETQIRLDYHTAQEARYRALGMPKMAAFHQKRREAVEVTEPVQAPEHTVYGTRIGRHWAFVVSNASDLLRFEGETTTAEYPCEACGADQMTLWRTGPREFAAWSLRCNECAEHYAVSEIPARQGNGQGE